MNEMRRDPRKDMKIVGIAGTGLCAVAQADGVPCYELGRDCVLCERARALEPEEKKEEAPPSEPQEDMRDW